MKDKLEKLINDTNPKWVVRKVESDPELMKYVGNFYGESLGQKIYTALYGLPEKCKYGNYPTFISLKKGYKERCGQQKDCNCAKELGLKNQRLTFSSRTPEKQKEINKKKSESYRKNRHNHFKRRKDIQVQPGFEYQTILMLLDELAPERYERTLNCYPELIEFMDFYTKRFNPESFLEKVYIIQTGPPKLNLCGKKPSFRNHWYGYNKFCNKRTLCSCSQISHSENIKKWHKSLGEKGKIKLTRKQQDGMEKKYGKRFAIQVPEIKEKMEKTCLKNLGYKTPLESPIVQQIIKQTNLKRLGVEYPFQSSDVRTRGLDTTIRVHGGLMIQAREKLNLIINNKNPFQDEDVKERIKQTNLKNCGYEHHRQSPENKKKYMESMMDRYGIKWPSQMHLDKDVFDILEDKNRFSQLCEKHSLNELSDMLGVSQGIIKSRHDKYDLNYFKSRSKSKYEDEIAHWLLSNNIEFKHDKKMPWGKTVDFLIGDVAIEFNGLYSHSQYSRYGMLLGIDKYYHYNKYIECKDAGIKLFTIFEDEWNDKKDVIKNKILIELGMGEIGDPGRKLKVKKIDYKTSANFLDVYHLQGSATATVYYGAYDTNNKLVAVMSFFQRNKDSWDLNRFACDEKVHSGLFSKMISKFEKDHNPSKLFSFSDNRWGHGDVYSLNGFEKQYELAPDYQVTDYKTREHKFNWRKNRIKSRFNVVIEGKTELDLTLELKRDRIWDCGKAKWLKEY